MTKAEINEIRSKPYNQCTYDELLWALDELEKAQAELVECHKWDGFLMAHGCFGEVDIAQIVEDDKAELEDA